MKDRTKPTRKTCPNCESPRLVTRTEREDFRYGTGAGAVQLAAEAHVHRCAACGFEFTDESSSEARHNAVCRHLGVYTPEEIRATRERYGMSQEEFAFITGLGKASLNRWENGLLIQNPANDRYLYLLSFPENLHRITNRGDSRERGQASDPRSNVVEFRPRFRAISQSEVSKITSDSESFELFVSKTRH